MHMCNMMDPAAIALATAWLLLLYYCESNPNLESHLPDCESGYGCEEKK
jgi:hypothetical protein